MKHEEQEEKLVDWLSRHKGLLFKVARSFARSSHDQNDLFQEIAVQVWKSIPTYRPVVKETTWLYRVALYTAINWNQKETKRKIRVQQVDPELFVADANPQPGDPRLDWLYEKISEMDLINRSLTLLMLEGCSYAEMSEALGISESNVGVRINRIKKQLTVQLERERTNDI